MFAYGVAEVDIGEEGRFREGSVECVKEPRGCSPAFRISHLSALRCREQRLGTYTPCISSPYSY